MTPDILIKLLLSLALGALVGIERERRGTGELVEGMRTFMLVSFFATLSAYFADILNSVLIIGAAFSFTGILAVFGYISKTRKQHFGLTTEIAFLLTFMIGLAVFYDSYPYILSIASGLILTLILASKGKMHHFAKHLKEEEIWDAMIFAIITFVILPILPNSYIGPFNAFNPFVIWSSIVLVLSISFAGYIAMKVFGVRKGIAFTGAFGGLASSTAVSIAMAEETRKYPKIFSTAAFAVTLASSTMFIRMFAVDILFNYNIATKVMFPFILLTAFGYLFSYKIWNKDQKEQKVNLSSPLSFKPAFSFGVFFVIIFFLSRFVNNYLGDSGILLFAFTAGLVEVDAINITLATLALTTLNPMIAVYGIILAAIANTISKWSITKFLGTNDLAKEVGKVFLFLLVTAIGLLFFVSI